MKKCNIIMIVLLITAGLIYGQGVYAEVKASYLFPTDQFFRDIYSGGLIPQLELGVRVGDQLEIALNTGYFGKTGELTFTKEETQLSIVSLGVLGRYLMTAKDLSPYIGAGLSYHLFSEESDVLDKLTHNQLGFTVLGGVYFTLSEAILLDVFIQYDSCKMEPGETAFNIGGIKAGAGLRFDF